MSSVVAQLAAIKEAMEEEVIAAAALAAAGKGLGALSGSIARGASGLLRDSAGGGSSPRAVTRAMSSTRWVESDAAGEPLLHASLCAVL
jgi:hypothetical protein